MKPTRVQVVEVGRTKRRFCVNHPISDGNVVHATFVVSKREQSGGDFEFVDAMLNQQCVHPAIGRVGCQVIMSLRVGTRDLKFESLLVVALSRYQLEVEFRRDCDPAEIAALVRAAIEEALDDKVELVERYHELFVPVPAKAVR